ncbi:oxidized low-density lipoprotein receptor 1-like [Hypanus sabinus]|uniref:oxidized low-density lipoprotein receptor 1-like n=1 Tax=Hypanus sabinus TaxID=79690 RepID=UPI0028C4F997|nr:oxidized low-density lipoprotein receptor 1-like [Hypanus sabinus]
MDSERPTRTVRSDPSIWLICVLTAALIITGICWRIHVSQIRQSNETCHRNSDLSELKRMHNDLRHQFTEMETKYRSVNETKAQICELLTSRRVPACPQGWIENEGRCYFLSILEESYDGATEHCSIFDARLLKINSNQEEEFVSIFVGEESKTYWIGKCGDGIEIPASRDLSEWVLSDVKWEAERLSSARAGVARNRRVIEINTWLRCWGGNEGFRYWITGASKEGRTRGGSTDCCLEAAKHRSALRRSFMFSASEQLSQFTAEPK